MSTHPAIAKAREALTSLLYFGSRLSGMPAEQLAVARAALRALDEAEASGKVRWHLPSQPWLVHDFKIHETCERVLVLPFPKEE